MQSQISSSLKPCWNLNACLLGSDINRQEINIFNEHRNVLRDFNAGERQENYGNFNEG
jgi:hypothetical protein